MKHKHHTISPKTILAQAAVAVFSLATALGVFLHDGQFDKIATALLTLEPGTLHSRGIQGSAESDKLTMNPHVHPHHTSLGTRRRITGSTTRRVCHRAMMNITM